MSKRGENNVCNSDSNKSLMSAVKEGNLEFVKNLVPSRGLSYCKDSHGGYVLLCNAIKSGHIQIAKFLLHKGARTDCKTYVGSPLHLAMKHKPIDTELISLLLKRNAAVDRQNGRKETPLHIAAKKGYTKIVQILLDFNASMTAQTTEGSTPLFLAAEGEHEEVVKVMAKHAFTIAKVAKDILPSVSLIEKRIRTQLLHSAVKRGQIDFTEQLLNLRFNANAKNEEEKTPICYSLNCNNESKCVKIIRLLLASGAEIKEAPALLHTAIAAGFIEVCKVLIKNGADVNALNVSGDTPIHLVVRTGDTNGRKRVKVGEATRNEIIELLLNNGADASILTRDGSTAFHRAVMLGMKETVCIFLNCGVNIDLHAKGGSTPLHLASQNGLTEMVEILCKNDANVDARQKNGSTPLHLAAHCKYHEIVKILLDNGCDINAETSDGRTALDIAYSLAKSDFADGQRDGMFDPRIYLMDSEDSDDSEYSYNYSSDDDSIDDGFFFDEYDTVVTLKRHIHKLHAVGVHVSRSNLDLLSDMAKEDSTFLPNCRKEVKRMKTVKLNPQITLFDILANKNCSRVKKLLLRYSSHVNLEKFPIYVSLLKAHFEKSKARRGLLLSGQKWLDIVIKMSSKLNGKKCTVLPFELLELIISYLSSNELRSLITCGKALKRQLTQ